MPQKKKEDDDKSFTALIKSVIPKIVGSLERIAGSRPPVEALMGISDTPISIATPIEPTDPDVIANSSLRITGYDRVSIVDQVHRLSPEVWVVNDGPGMLYVICSPDLIKWNGENQINPGEAWAFYNVRELRLRSPVAGTQYRLSEYKPDGNIDSGLVDVTLIPLAANGTYTSSALNPTFHTYARALAFADQAGTVYIEQSSDGVNWDLSETVAVVANTATRLEKTIVGAYVRFKYVNGAVAQTVLRLTGRLTGA